MSFRENYKKKKDEEETTTSSGTFRRAYREAIEKGTDVEWTPTSPTYTTSQAQPTEPEEKKKSIWETVKGYAKDVVSGKVKERNKELAKKDEEERKAEEREKYDVTENIVKPVGREIGSVVGKTLGLGVAYAPEKGGTTEEDKKRAEEEKARTGAATDTSEKNITKRQILGGTELASMISGGGEVYAAGKAGLKTLSKEGIKNLIKQSAKSAVRTGAREGVYGGVYGTATGLEEEKPTIESVTKSAGINAAMGAGGGVVFGGASPVAGKIINKIRALNKLGTKGAEETATKAVKEVAELNKKADIGTATEAGFTTKEVGTKVPVTSTVVKKELPEVVKEVTPQTITIDQAADKILQASEGISKTKNVTKINKILKDAGVERADRAGISKILKTNDKRADITKTLQSYNKYATERAKKFGTKEPEIRETEMIKLSEGVTQKYKTIHGGGKIVEVEGEPVKIADGIDTFIHKDGNGNWLVSETTTGRSITTGGWENPYFATKEATENINNVGVDRYKEAIAKYKLPESTTSEIKTTEPSTTKQINELTDYEGAPDRARVEGYKQKIKNGEDIEPIKIIEEKDGTLGVEDGKHRLQAMKELGYKEIPVEPTLKPSKYAERVKAESVEKGIKEDFAEIAGYEPQKIKEQSKRATDLINSDLDKAIRIIDGKETAPEGVSETYLMRAMEEHAKKTGDAELMEKLVKSPLASETSRYGSEIAMLRGTTDSPVKKIKDLNKTMVENAGGQKKVNELVNKEKDSLKRLVDSETIKGTKEWSSVLEQLRC